jgi:hypothetical protein
LLEDGHDRRRRICVNEQRQEQTGGPAPAEPKAEWTPLELWRMQAGAAEFGDSIIDDGPGFS